MNRIIIVPSARGSGTVAARDNCRFDDDLGPCGSEPLPGRSEALGARYKSNMARITIQRASVPEGCCDSLFADGGPQMYNHGANKPIQSEEVGNEG